jgi:hypothetical protein
MSTERFINNQDGAGSLASNPSAANSPLNGLAEVPPARKARQRSVYLFPAYSFAVALDIARRVEESGGGTLTEETLALGLGLSAKSSGFRLKSLAARQFQLVSKQGKTLASTSVAKAILKPTSNEDAQRGYCQSFLSIPLFRAVTARYGGQRLPDSQTLRNVLEREFHVEHARVQQAERMLLDSARDTQLLKHEGDGTYLNVPDYVLEGLEDPSEFGAGTTDNFGGLVAGHNQSASSSVGSLTHANTITFTLEEIGQLSGEDFETVWRAIGILVKSRGRRIAMEQGGALAAD